jgi:hypothetical protein
MENASRAFLDAVRKTMARSGGSLARPRSTRACSHQRKGSSTRGICGGRRTTQHSQLSQGWALHQGDRAPHRTQPGPRPQDFAGPAVRCLPVT